jgi:hypothetical protein
MRAPFAALLCLLLAGCTVDHQPFAAGQRPSAGSADASRVFEPVALRVHPLTHVDTADDDCMLIAHVELRDAYADSVKGLGDLVIEAEGPTGERVAWDIPGMLDPQANTRRFDPPTRTYRLPLRCPAWVRSWAALPRGTPLIVKARLTRPDGEQLSGEIALQR